MASVQLSVLGRKARVSRFWNKATETMLGAKLNAGFVEVEPLAGLHTLSQGLENWYTLGTDCRTPAVQWSQRG